MHVRSKDVAIPCINQFPKFVDNAKNIIDALERFIHYTLENDQESEDAVIKTYQEAIEVLKERASDPNISLEEARQLALDITDIADKIATLHKNKQEFAMSLHNKYYAVLMTIVVSSSALLGVKLLGKK